MYLVHQLDLECLRVSANRLPGDALARRAAGPNGPIVRREHLDGGRARQEGQGGSDGGEVHVARL